jgi:D-alanyl-D-alanine carboxypeptidase
MRLVVVALVSFLAGCAVQVPQCFAPMHVDTVDHFILVIDRCTGEVIYKQLPHQDFTPA